MIREDFEHLFSKIAPPEPPAGLFSAIMSRIRKEEQRLAFKKRVVLFSLGLLASAGALTSAVAVFGQEFVQSDFPQFVSLVFSDLGTISMNWKDFSLALLESFPAMSFIAFLTAILIFLWSLKHFFIIRPLAE